MMRSDTAAGVFSEILFQRHKSEIEVGKKTAEELLSWARSFVDLEKVPPLTLLARLSWARIMEWMEREMGTDSALVGKAPALDTFRLPRTSRNQPFYDGEEDGREITLWIERHSVYFQTNSAHLHALLSRGAGISPKDLADRGEAFQTYIFHAFLDDPENPQNPRNIPSN